MKTKKATTQKAGGSLSRSEIVQVRVDPKLKMSAELAAASERRTVSSFIEWAIQRAVREVVIAKDDSGKPLTAAQVVERVWDVDEADRIVKLAITHPELLTHEEQRVWKVIQSVDWKEHSEGVTRRWRLIADGVPRFPVIRRFWSTLQAIADAEARDADYLEEIRPLYHVLTDDRYGFQPEIIEEHANGT